MLQKMSNLMAPAFSSVNTNKIKRFRIPSSQICDVANNAQLALSSHQEARNQAQHVHNAEATRILLAPSMATTSKLSRKCPNTSVSDANDNDNDVIEVIFESRHTSEGKFTVSHFAVCLPCDQLQDQDHQSRCEHLHHPSHLQHHLSQS
jgi:hypothetical protein